MTPVPTAAAALSPAPAATGIPGRNPRSIALLTHVSGLLAFLLLMVTPLLAQGKNMGQATQYYKQTPPKKFKVIGPKKESSSEITWTDLRSASP